MSFESFIIAELCIIAILFIFDLIRGNRKNKSRKNPGGHFDGRIVINTTDPYKEVFRLEYDGNLAELPDKPHVTFQIVRED